MGWHGSSPMIASYKAVEAAAKRFHQMDSNGEEGEYVESKIWQAGLDENIHLP